MIDRKKIEELVRGALKEAFPPDRPVDTSEALVIPPDRGVNLGAPYELLRWVAANGRLPVPNFAAGGIATPADAALMMSLGAEAVFVGSGIFKSENPAARARAVVRATTHYQDAKMVAEASRGLGEPMRGIAAASVAPAERLQTRGW